MNKFQKLQQQIMKVQDINNMVYTTDKQLTIQEAADILNVSCQHLIELIEKQIITHTKINTQRYVCFNALVNYKNERDKKRYNGLTNLTQKSQKLNLYSIYG